MKSFDDELRSLKAGDLLRSPVTVQSHQGPSIAIDGQRYTNFSSNDYLDLSGHDDIVKEVIRALGKYGFGSGASRLLSGTMTPHRELEERVAGFKRTEAAIVFNSGYAANTGIIPVLAGDNSVIFSDELNHASIIDGTRLSGSTTKIYRHKDLNHLESLLKKSVRQKNRVIITDTVFSMDGDIAPLKDIYHLSCIHDALLIIDDAHATGVLGETGRGGLEHFNVKGKNIIQMGTLSKAAGVFGAFVAGRRKLITLLASTARSFMYSTSLPPAVAAAGVRALDIIDLKSTGRRKRLWQNRNRLYQGLAEMKFDLLESETPIIPVLVGDLKKAMKAAKYLYRNTIFAPAIRPPTVPEDKCRIRFTVTAGHTGKDIDTLLGAMRALTL